MSILFERKVNSFKNVIFPSLKIPERLSGQTIIFFTINITPYTPFTPFTINFHLFFQLIQKYSNTRKSSPIFSLPSLPVPMSKEAILMLCDAGSSMDEMYSEDISRLKLAMICIEITLKQKVFQNSMHEVGFALFGQKEDPKYFRLLKIERPTTDFIRKIHELSQAQLGNDLKGGDIFDAIDHAIRDMQMQCAKKKSSIRRMFVFTNGMGKSIYRAEDIELDLAPRLKNADIRLNVIPINFMQGYAMQQNQVQTEITHEEQIQNAKLLMDLKAAAPGYVEIFPDQIALELYNRFRKRDVNPVAVFKGELDIGGELKINVESFKMVRRQRIKGLAKYDVNVPFNPAVTKQKQIIIQTKYIVQGDQTSTPVEPQDRINAYPYGPNLLPISGILEKDAKWYEDRNLKLLAFVDKSKIPRQVLMSEVQLVVPVKGILHNPGQKTFTALVYSMLTLKKYAICRYVPRNNKNGVVPRLVVLMPWRKADRQGMLLVDLPTVEDMRDYPFNPLKPSTQRHRNLVKELIKSANLYQKIGDEQFQILKVQNTFNPFIQYFFQAVFYRALNVDDELPQPDKMIIESIRPQLRIIEQTKPLMKDMAKIFNFKKKLLAKQKAENKKALGWNQLIQDNMPEITESGTMSESGDVPLKPHKMFDDEHDVDKFDETDPLRSFSRMLNNNKVDLVSDALTSMSNYITQKSKGAVSKQMFDGLVQCASALRRGCDEQQQRIFWDEWLSEGKRNLNPTLFKLMMNEGLMYFNKDNRELTRQEVHTPIVTTEEEFADLD